MDAIHMILGGIIGLLSVLFLGICAFGIYDCLTAETFSLRKDGWVCTRQHTVLVPMTTMVGKVPVTTLVPSDVCDQWTAR